MSSVVNDQIEKLENLFNDLNENGMPRRSGSVWPVIIRYNTFGSKLYEYTYPRSFFENLQYNNRIVVSYEHKQERLSFVKFVIDNLMTGKSNIFLYHFGMYLIYNSEYRRSKAEEDLTEKSIGKRRAQFVQTLPIARFMSTEDFISAVWSYQVKDWNSDIGEHRTNPSMSNLRILFKPEQFSSWTGLHYGNADWVEPISGASDLKCKKWTKEIDPMTQESSLPEGWVEGPIILGHEGSNSGYRHFVAGEPVHAGSAIQVKFGKGWVEGRYEWSFDSKSPIRVHSEDDVFYIEEGHTVRVHS